MLNESTNLTWQVATLVVLLLGISSPSLSEQPLEFNNCELATLDGRGSLSAQCSNWQQPLNAHKPNDKLIDLFIVKLQSLSPAPQNDPLVIINGGPGGSSVDLLIDLASLNIFKLIRNGRDIIVLDQRGTGRSSPLSCPQLSENQIVTTDQDTLLLAEECLSELNFDPRYFSTSAAIIDIDSLRRAIGYQSINIYGVSYGTRVAVQYAREFPQATRSLIVDGVVPPTLALGPDVPVNSQTALDQVFEECAQSRHCSLAFPKLEKNFKNLSATLKTRPSMIIVNDPLTGKPSEMDFSYEHLVLAVRMSLYNPELRSLLPLLIYQGATEKNLTGIASTALQLIGQLQNTISNAMHNSVVCTEDLPFTTSLKETIEASQSTYIGAEFFQTLKEICSVWPPGVISQNLKEPFKSAIPTLILSGELDPVTPPSYGELLASGLENSLHIIAKGQGHGIITRGCIPKLISDFIDNPDVLQLDTSCTKDLSGVPFFVNSMGPSP